MTCDNSSKSPELFLPKLFNRIKATYRRRSLERELSHVIASLVSLRMDAQSTSGSERESTVAQFIVLIVFSVLLGFWCMGFVISTRCCRHFGPDSHIYDRGVWSVEMLSQQEQDRRLARQLQEAEFNLTPEEIERRASEFEKRRVAREQFVDQKLPSKLCDMSSDVEGDHLNHTKCAICLAPYITGDCLTESTTQRCKHEFHRKCILDWLIRNSHCPVCREIYLLEDVKDNPETSISQQSSPDVQVSTEIQRIADA